MTIIYFKNKEQQAKTYAELAKTNKFMILDPDKDLRDQILLSDGTMRFYGLDWTGHKSSDLNLEMLQLLDDESKIFILFDNDGPHPIPGPNPPRPSGGGIPMTIINDLPPYPNFSTIAITQSLHLPWNAIYTQYFWFAISTNGIVNLFDNKPYELTSDDVSIFILASRYFSKVRDIFKFDNSVSADIQNIGRTLTYVLHDLEEKAPIRSARDLVSKYNIGPKYDKEVIIKHLVTNTNEQVGISYASVEGILAKMSDFLKQLNFDCWLLAIMGRKTLERFKNDFVSRFDTTKYMDYYRFLSGLEHATDYSLGALFEFASRDRLQQIYDEIKTLYGDKIL